MVNDERDVRVTRYWILSIQTVFILFSRIKKFLLLLCVYFGAVLCYSVCVFQTWIFYHMTETHFHRKKRNKMMIFYRLTRNNSWKDNWCEWIEVTSFTNPFTCQSRTVKSRPYSIISSKLSVLFPSLILTVFVDYFSIAYW